MTEQASVKIATILYLSPYDFFEVKGLLHSVSYIFDIFCVLMYCYGTYELDLVVKCFFICVLCLSVYATLVGQAGGSNLNCEDAEMTGSITHYFVFIFPLIQHLRKQ